MFVSIGHCFLFFGDGSFVAPCYWEWASAGSNISFHLTLFDSTLLVLNLGL